MRIKFCGVTDREDAELAAQAGAWAIGLNFWNRSPRRCRRSTAVEIAAALRRRIELVGVFVNASLDDIARVVDAVGLTGVQLHGDEGPAFCAEVARRTGATVTKAMRVRSGADLQALHAFHTDYHLLDSFVAGVPGGTGQTFAWELVPPPRRRDVPLILSGGLDPENVSDAIAAVQPFAVDVASGVEVPGAPGRKDPAALTAFADAVRGAAVPL